MVAKTIIAKDNGASLHKRIAKLEAENSQLKATTAESAETIGMLQRAMDNRVEDYNLLMEGNKSLLAERNDINYRCVDLKIELAEVHSDSEKKTADLEVRVKTAEAHSVDVATAGEKQLRDFEGGLVRDLAELQALYVCNAHTIGGLCSPMPESEPSTADYLHCLSTEISGLPDIFGGVNENFVTAAVERALVMDRASVDLDALQSTVIESGADVLPIERDV
jgi:hypothetical protein